MLLPQDKARIKEALLEIGGGVFAALIEDYGLSPQEAEAITTPIGKVLELGLMRLWNTRNTELPLTPSPSGDKMPKTTQQS